MNFKPIKEYRIEPDDIMDMEIGNIDEFRIFISPEQVTSRKFCFDPDGECYVFDGPILIDFQVGSYVYIESSDEWWIRDVDKVLASNNQVRSTWYRIALALVPKTHRTTLLLLT